MGYASGPVCFSEAASAASAACSSVGGSTGAGVVACQGVASVSGSGAVLNLAFTSPAGVVGAQQSIVFEACEPLTVADGIELGWLLGAAFIGVAALRAIGKARGR